MRDDLVGGVADGRHDEDVEAARDEDGRDEAQQEEQDHVVPDERTAGKVVLGPSRYNVETEKSDQQTRIP